MNLLHVIIATTLVSFAAREHTYTNDQYHFTLNSNSGTDTNYVISFRRRSASRDPDRKYQVGGVRLFERFREEGSLRNQRWA
jgi:hypothetical protein